MKAAGPNHSNALLVMVIASVFGAILYALILYFGGWPVLIGVFLISALVWCLLLLFNQWPHV